MAAELCARGTRSMSTSLMSRRMARVVSSTSTANRNVQIGSASAHRGSPCGQAVLVPGRARQGNEEHGQIGPGLLYTQLLTALSGRSTRWRPWSAAGPAQQPS